MTYEEKAFKYWRSLRQAVGSGEVRLTAQAWDASGEEPSGEDAVVVCNFKKGNVVAHSVTIILSPEYLEPMLPDDVHRAALARGREIAEDLACRAEGVGRYAK